VPACIKNCERKNAPQNLYLTVEQVRVAACAWVEAHAYPPSARTVVYEKAVSYILYHQQRNRQARPSHWKTTIQKLETLGIDVRKLKSCIPGEP
jgi:hypothetical protein